MASTSSSLVQNRLVLVIASQCDDMNELSFLPASDWEHDDDMPTDRQLPVDLYRQFVDPASGACIAPDLAELETVPVENGSDTFVDGPAKFLWQPSSGLLINPTKIAADAAIRETMRQAYGRAPGVVIYFVGHGAENGDNTSFLLLKNSKAIPEDDHSGWDPYRLIRNRRDNETNVPLLIIVDACFASSAKTEIDTWATTASHAPYYWMGSSHDEVARSGQFTKVVVDLMTNGAPASDNDGVVSPQIGAHLLGRIANARTAASQTVATAESSGYEPALFLCNNRARQAVDQALGFNDRTRRRYQASLEGPHQPVGIHSIETEFAAHDFAVVVGGAGTGKTRLASALREPSATGETGVGFNAISYLERSSTIDSIAEDLHPQLLSNQQYKAAHRIHRTQTADTYDLSQTPSQRYLAGPFTHMTQGSVTVIVDGLDQLDEHSTRTKTIEALEHLVDVSPHQPFRCLCTSRPEGPIPNDCHQIPVPSLTPPLARSYLQQRGELDPDRVDQIVALDNLNWLILTMASNVDPTSPDLGSIYESVISDASSSLSSEVVDRAIAVLVAAGSIAGVGPRLPFAIFETAVRNLDTGTTGTSLYRLLANPALYQIIERSYPATPDEHVGLFHLTAIEELQPDADRLIDAHSAIADAITELEPSATNDHDELAVVEQ